MQQDAHPYPPSDPDGHYARLGVGPLADTVEIRAAYHRLAKELHPDVNLSENAEQEFIALNESYRILKDSRRRARYDATARPQGPQALIDPQDPDPRPLCCCRCGKVTAQPRYIVFSRVKSFLWITVEKSISGIFCRDCADRTAIHAATLTWLLGWWSLTGPWRSMRALIVNLKGGRMPREDNLWVLLHQARAFLRLGQLDIARGLADQAQEFARSAAARRRIGEVIRSCSTAGDPALRRLKDRWAGLRYATVAQALPLAGMAGALVVVIAVTLMHARTDRVTAMITIEPAQAGELRHVAVDVLKVRQGPSDAAPVIALLDRFSTVQVVDAIPDGSWARILTPSGVTGYVPVRFLFGGAGELWRNRWCIDNQGAPPANGDVLLRRSGGDHELSVRNSTGQDVVVRLKTQNSRTLLSFFMARNGQAVIDGIPDGTFRAVFATGHTYSHACGVFLDAMRTFIVPTAQVFTAAAQNGRRLELTLPPEGDGPGQARPLPMESFLDN
jgi:hypothetical protein